MIVRVQESKMVAQRKFFHTFCPKNPEGSLKDNIFTNINTLVHILPFH